MVPAGHTYLKKFIITINEEIDTDRDKLGLFLPWDFTVLLEVHKGTVYTID